MQIYVHDPLEDDWSGRFEPSNNFRVDFGFWTGTNLIAVEIDGNEPDGYARDIRRDRLLRRANVDVVHILNTEIDRHGKKVIRHVLPERIRSGWRAAPVPTSSPFIPF
jgi:very-short-patch-repair endonuclease